MKPIRIGITRSGGQKEFKKYVGWLSQYDNPENPLEIIILHTASSTNHLPALDGLIMTGGKDISPDYYRAGSIVGKSARDVSEENYFKHYYPTIPVLGICRGMQLINCILGGTLLEDIQGGKHETGMHRLISLNGDTSFVNGTVNSFHHQCLESIATGLIPVAASTDGIIEAVRGDKMLLVQFHPEKDSMEDSNVSVNVLNEFIKMCQ